MTSFFAGNAKNILIKKQADKDTVVADFSDAMSLRVYEWSKAPVRVIDELKETDSSTQQGDSHVAAIAPGITFGVYGRPSELDLICMALLGANDDEPAGDLFSHTATPDIDSPYYSIMETLPYGNAVVYDGCRLAAATFAGQDEGETELKVTGLTWIVLGVTEDVSPPDPLPDPADELPFIYAEAAVSYDGSSPGSTTAFSLTVTRNTTRAQGDVGFRALDAVHGKFQVDGTVTRYTQDDATMRAVDTGSESGTTPTSAIFSEAFAVSYERGSGDDLRSFDISAPEVSYPTRDEAIDLDGRPFKEVLGFRTERQETLAENVEIITVNAKATPDS